MGEGGNPAGEILESPPEHLDQPRAGGIGDSWIGRDCGDHELHQYFQPLGHDRGGIAGAQSGRGGSEMQTVGENLLGTRLTRRDALSRQGRPHAVSREVGLQSGGIWLHHLHRQLRPIARRDRRGRDDAKTWPSLQSCRAIEISRGAFIAQVKASYLSSPPLCVAYALAGTVTVRLDHGSARDAIREGPAHFSDGISGPRPQEVQALVAASVSSR